MSGSPFVKLFGFKMEKLHGPSNWRAWSHNVEEVSVLTGGWDDMLYGRTKRPVLDPSLHGVYEDDISPEQAAWDRESKRAYMMLRWLLDDDVKTAVMGTSNAAEAYEILPRRYGMSAQEHADVVCRTFGLEPMSVEATARLVQSMLPASTPSCGRARPAPRVSPDTKSCSAPSRRVQHR